MGTNYVVAGFKAMADYTDKFIKSEYFDDHFTREDVSNFFFKNCNNFLHGFGQNFKNKKRFDKHKKFEAKTLSKFRSYKFFDKSYFWVDSSGFQISIGILSKEEAEILNYLYYEFLCEEVDKYDKAFILDIPPGPGCQIFDNFKSVYDWNYRSYKKASLLSEEVRNKIVYVHHFRTPKLWEIYLDLLRSNDFYKSFTKFATGGIVANMRSDMIIPCIIYVLPLIPLLNETIKNGRKKIEFHILGGANFRDILFYELFRIHVKKIHDIDLIITFDSSGLFKGLMMSRFLWIEYEGVMRKVDIRTNNIDMRFEDNIKVIDIFRYGINKMARENNFKEIKIDNIYDDTTGTFSIENRIYSLLYMLYMYSEVQNNMRDFSEKVYEFYDKGEIDIFNLNVEEMTKNLNSGKITKKQRSKSYSVSNSLDMLTSLDEEYCKYIIDKCLSKDEFTNLDNNYDILEI